MEVEQRVVPPFSEVERMSDARQLRSKCNNRPTIEVADEYELQDLSHALWKFYLEVIRREEWVQSYAEKSS
jgi:hypothetical protein